MRRTSLVAILVFVAGLGIGYFARNLAGVLQRRTHAADLAAIEKAHQEDIEATLTQDPKRLMDEWAEDGVKFTPGSPPVVGKQAIAADNEKFHAQYPGLKVLNYTSKYKNFKSRTAWRASGSKKKPSISCPQSPRRSVGTLTDC
jgi:hypothetical protein